MRIVVSTQNLKTTAAQLQVTCTKILQSSQISAVTLEVRNGGAQVKYQNIVYCNGLPVQIQYEDLQQNTHYNVTVTSNTHSAGSCGVKNFVTLLSK